MGSSATLSSQLRIPRFDIGAKEGNTGWKVLKIYHAINFPTTNKGKHIEDSATGSADLQNSEKYLTRIFCYRQSSKLKE